MERSCKNCQQRRVGCHANCERYKADCAQDAKRRAYEKQFAYLDSMPQTATALKRPLHPGGWAGNNKPKPRPLNQGGGFRKTGHNLPII